MSTAKRWFSFANARPHISSYGLVMSENWHFAKHFSVNEAQKLISWVREVFGQIHALVGYRPQKPLGGNGNGKNGSLSMMSQYESAEEARQVAESLLRVLEDAGILVRDWRRGLVDFPAILGGEEVFLCYELADGDRILYYHGLNEGYAGRRPIEEKGGPQS